MAKFNSEIHSVAILVDGDGFDPAVLTPLVEKAAKLGPITLKKIFKNTFMQDSFHLLAQAEANSFEIVHVPKIDHRKNAADIRMVIEVMDLLYTSNIDAFVLVSNDLDFVPILERIKAAKKHVVACARDPVPFGFREICPCWPISSFRYRRNRISIEGAEALEPINPATPNETEQEAALKALAETNPVAAVHVLLWEVWNRPKLKKHRRVDGFVDVSYAGAYIRTKLPKLSPGKTGFPSFRQFIQGNPDRYEYREFSENGKMQPYFRLIEPINIPTETQENANPL